MLAGNIVKGIIRIGDWIEFNLNGSIIKRKIIAIEGIRSLKENINCGLIIETSSTTEIEELNNWDPNGLLAQTYSHHDN